MDNPKGNIFSIKPSSDFVVALIMFILIAEMAVEKDMKVRMFLILPIILLYSLAKILYSRNEVKRIDKIIEKMRKES